MSYRANVIHKKQNDKSLCNRLNAWGTEFSDNFDEINCKTCLKVLGLLPQIKHRVAISPLATIKKRILNRIEELKAQAFELDQQIKFNQNLLNGID